MLELILSALAGTAVLVGIVVLTGRGWRRRLMVSEARKTITAVRSLPHHVQYLIAEKVYTEIAEALAAIEETPSAPEAVMLLQVRRATALRRQAIREGATDRSDPNWASAAIFESWIQAKSGIGGDTTFCRIDELTFSWLGGVLGVTQADGLKSVGGTP